MRSSRTLIGFLRIVTPRPTPLWRGSAAGCRGKRRLAPGLGHSSSTSPLPRQSRPPRSLWYPQASLRQRLDSRSVSLKNAHRAVDCQFRRVARSLGVQKGSPDSVEEGSYTTPGLTIPRREAKWGSTIRRYTRPWRAARKPRSDRRWCRPRHVPAMMFLCYFR